MKGLNNMDIVLPYIGSKKRILKHIRNNVKVNDLCVSAFSGGCSLELNLLELGLIKTLVINDLDYDVYNFWMCIKHNYWGVVESIERLLRNIKELDLDKSNKEGYINDLNSFIKTDEDKAGIFYLYKRFNIGLADKKIYKTNDYDMINFTNTFSKASNLLKNAIILNKSYDELLYYDSYRTFWYLDPPFKMADNDRYYKVCKNKEFNHEDFRLFIGKLRGKFILSYDDCDFIKDLYKCYNINIILVYSFLRQGYRPELLISNYELNIQSDSIFSNNSKELIFTRNDELLLSDVLDIKQKFVKV